MADFTLDRRGAVTGLIGLAGAGPAAAAETPKGPLGKLSPWFKSTEFVFKADGLSSAQFVEHWRTVRAPLVKALPGLLRAVFNPVDKTLSPEVRYDAVVQLWFKDAAAYRACFNGAHAEVIEALAKDAPKFMQPDFLGMYVREDIVRAPAPGAPRPKAKRIGLVGRHPGTDQAAFFQAWRDKHAREVDPQYGLQAYKLNLIDRERFPDSPYDGYAELWWTDWAAHKEASRQIATAYQARSDFFHSHLTMLISDEQDA
jgi:uncharacterized protein (TIGR02118 family)